MALIGIPTRHLQPANHPLPAIGTSCSYTESILNAGGTPLLIPLVGETQEQVAAHVERYSGCYDGLLLPGGEDVDPARYNTAPHAKTQAPAPARDALELALFAAAVSRRIPILGICRGLQLINVARGGSLIQDIPSCLPEAGPHNTDDWHARTHEVALTPNSTLQRIYGTQTLKVNSLHHQAAERLGSGLRAVAHSSADAVIEAVEDPDYPFLIAVQWHPEVLWQNNRDADLSLTLFKAFINAAK